MSRFLSQPLSRLYLRGSPTAGFSHRRCSSSKVKKAEFIELDIDQASSSQSNSPDEVIALGIKKLEDAINSIVLRRAAPDWLPFLPGYSFLPPHAKSGGYNHNPTDGLIGVVGRLASSEGGVGRVLPLNFVTEEEILSFTSPRGWPSSSFFIEGSMPAQFIQMVQVEFKIQGDTLSSVEDDD